METDLLQLSYTLETIAGAAKQFREATTPYNLFAFSGDMGAGKTTFIHALCDLLQVQDNVSSPTFALINEYHFSDEMSSDKIIYHLDWYRLRNSEEAFNAGMGECIEQAKMGAALCFVEWPEQAPDLLQAPYLWISIETTSLSERHMTVKLIG